MTKQEINKVSATNPDGKKTYSQPTLTEFGRVRELTTGGSGTAEEDMMELDGRQEVPMP